MANLFGTDGVRGVAYEPPLDRETVTRIGFALAKILGSSSRVLIGRDTRRSGPDIERWLLGGLAMGGATAESAGVITTPAVSYLTKSEGFEAGIVISASHNPYRDNGIKILTASGSKSSAELEEGIEGLVSSAEPLPEASPVLAAPDPRFEDLYLDHLLSVVEHPHSLPKLEIALDCANGAAYHVGPRLLREIGLIVHPLSCEPDGENINDHCGSTDLALLRAAVAEKGLELGAALDGDGDRLLLVDADGQVINGDAILLLCARRLKREGRLRSDGVVATVMSNMALERALDEDGIRLFRTRVGDKFVAQGMAERHIILGGEQSGHIIFSDYGLTGDGLLTLLQVLRVMALESKSLGELGRLTPFPQVLLNVRVKDRPEVSTIPAIAEAMERAERALDGRGRILVRYSGTEPLLRIMMEGPEQAEIASLAADIARAVESSIGADE